MPGDNCFLSFKSGIKHVGRSFVRIKNHRTSNPETNDLHKCLTTFDLTNLGIGSILGAGIYVVSGQVALNVAGPSIILSFTIAAFTSLLSGLCYAEFGSRVPNTTGSAYAYSYRTVGEFIAFVIGWNLILEYMIGTAADARALSSSIDYLLNYTLSDFSKNHIGIIPKLNTYPDFLGFLLTIIVTVILACGVKESARYSMIFNILNAGVALMIIVLGSYTARPSLWAGSNFAPKGVDGVFAGAASCFYAFVGFDIIATTGKEAHSPSKSIPKAVAFSLFTCFFLYIGVSSVLTMNIEFKGIVSQSPYSELFEYVGIHWATWVISFGAMFGLCASLLGSEFPLPRIIYAMSVDGLLFKFFRYVSSRTGTPVIATLLPGFLTAFFTMIFDLSELVEMMSIGTLLAYSLVCTSILLLRYRDCSSMFRSASCRNSINEDIPNEEPHVNGFAIDNEVEESNPNANGPTEKSTFIVNILTCFVWIFAGILSLIFTFAEEHLKNLNVVLICITVIIGIALISCSFAIWSQPQDLNTLEKLHFKVPLVPFLPITAIVINISLIARLSSVTWLRFVAWMSLGFIIYFFYGMPNSEQKLLENRTDEAACLLEDGKMPLLMDTMDDS